MLHRTAMLSLWLLGPGASAHAATEVGDIVARHGLIPVDPPSAAPDFTLPDLSGTERTLSESQGGWVLLTFFASWCGPCASEMPALQQLHDARSEQGLSVFGVSIDRTTAAAERFVRKHRVAFPVVVDTRSEAARLYQANAVPISFLIDPTGQLVGVARGARDWTRATALADELLGVAPADPSRPPAWAPPSQPLALPPSVEPPTASVALDGGPAAPGDTVTLRVDVDWAGELVDYVLHPPTVHLPEGVQHLGTSASSTSVDGRQRIAYSVRLKAPAPGTYALDPVELSYTPRLEPEPLTARIDGVELVVAAPSAGTLPLVAGGVGGLVVVGGIAAVALRRRRRPTRVEEEPAHMALRAQLDEARAARVRGDTRSFLEGLGAILEALGPGSGDPEALRALVERARYGGASVSRGELDALERRVARGIAALERSAVDAASDKLLGDAQDPQDEPTGDLDR